MSGLERQVDVAVVGGGPVGVTLGVLLAERGWSVEILERWAEPYRLPRAVHLDDEAARVLQACGLGRDLSRVTEAAPLYEWRNGAGTPLLRLGRSGEGVCGWPASAMFHQPTLEALLQRRAVELGVGLRRGREVTDLQPHADGVTVVGADGQSLRSRYLVGCDGADSTVAALVGLPSCDLGFSHDWLIVDVVPAEPKVFEPINLQVCDPARPTTAVSGGPGRRRFEFMCLPGESLDRLSSPERAWELLERWGLHPGNATLERHASYRFAARYATRWREGRVLVAGDAAHQMPPFAGQGLCAGLRDAANLAWKLDLVLAGTAPDALLDAYQAERLPEVRASIDFSVELGRVICVADPAEAAARDQAMAAAVGPDPIEVPALPPIAAGLVELSTPLAGQLFPQGRCGGVRFDDVHGAGWRLVTLPQVAPEGGPPTGWFDAIGGRVVTVAADDPFYGAWFARHGVAAAVQRPDFHLYGTASDRAGLTRLLAGLRSRLRLPSATPGA